jgi:hypothetical protein
MDILGIIAATPALASYLPYAAGLLGICAIIAAQLPPPTKPTGVYHSVYVIVNILGQNYKHARNDAISADGKSKPCNSPAAPLP